MKYCSKCGSELLDEAVVCPKCGCETEYGVSQKEKAKQIEDNNGAKTFGILSLVFGALGGILGLIFGITCIKKDKTGNYKPMGIIGIVLFAVWVVVYGIISAMGA